MKRFVVVLGVTLIILASFGIGLFFGIGYFLSPQDPLTKVDAIVAISGGETDARTAEAVQLYKDGWAPRIIFSGAALDSSGPSNAKAMANAAVAAGVPTSDILLDETSINTRANAANVAALIHTRGYHSIILVTSPYHQRRASIVFHRELGAGVAILNHSSVDHNWRRSHWWATPYSQQLTYAELQKVAYEIIANRTP